MNSSKQRDLKVYRDTEREDSTFQFIDEIYYDLEMEKELESEIEGKSKFLFECGCAGKT